MGCYLVARGSYFFKSSLFLLVISLSFAVAGRIYNGSAAEKGLQCSQLKTVWEWSSLRYGGQTLPNLESDEYAKRIAEQFLGRLDPNHFLLTSSEEAGFIRNATSGWKAAIRKSDCRYFENFVRSTWTNAKTRAQSHVRSENIKAASLRFREADKEEELPKFLLRPSSEKEYSERLANVVSKMLESTSPKLRKAYDNDLKKLALERVQDTFFSTNDQPMVPTLMAKAMLSAMDRYSTFYPQEEFKDFYSDLAGTVTGIGIRISKSPKGLLIERVLPQSPAGEKGIKAGDVIESIDGNVLEKADFEVAKALLKGEEKTWVNLSVIREDQAGKTKKIVFKVQRSVFSEEEARVTSKWVKVNGKQALVITIPSFYGRGGLEAGKEEKSSAEDVEEILKKALKKSNFAGPVVLDLRGNPGGYLEEAVTMGGLFLGDKVVVGILERNERRVLKGGRTTALYHGPLAVWVDGESASAAEVLSGALKDHGRALVLGDRSSYGKGSVQRLFHLADDFVYFSDKGQNLPLGVVKLTTSYFYSPLGHNPSNGGVSPHLTLAKKTESTPMLEKRSDSSRVADTTPFLSDREASQLRVRDTEIRTLVTQILKGPDSGEDDEEDLDESEVLRYTLQFATYSVDAKSATSGAL